MKFVKFLDHHFEALVVSVLLAILAILMLVAAGMRHLTPGADPWALRAAATCLAWLVFIGIPCAAAESLHLKAVFLERKLPPRAKGYVSLLASILFLVFAFLAFIASCLLFRQSLQEGVLYSLKPLVYLSAPVGFALTIFRLVERLWKLRRKTRGGRA